MSADTASAVAQLATTGAATAQKFMGAKQQKQAGEDILQLAADEATRTHEAAAANAAVFRQRSFAALQDVAIEEGVTKSRNRAISALEPQILGKIAGQAAGSGVELAGSPLLAMLDASLEVNKQIANNNIISTFGKRRLRFEAEQATARAEDILTGADEEAAASQRLRQLQAQLLKQRQQQTILGGVGTLLSPSNTKALTDLFKTKPAERPIRGLEYVQNDSSLRPLAESGF